MQELNDSLESPLQINLSQSPPHEPGGKAIALCSVEEQELFLSQLIMYNKYLDGKLHQAGMKFSQLHSQHESKSQNPPEQDAEADASGLTSQAPSEQQSSSEDSEIYTLRDIGDADLISLAPPSPFDSQPFRYLLENEEDKFQHKVDEDAHNIDTQEDMFCCDPEGGMSMNQSINVQCQAEMCPSLGQDERHGNASNAPDRNRLEYKAGGTFAQKVPSTATNGKERPSQNSPAWSTSPESWGVQDGDGNMNYSFELFSDQETGPHSPEETVTLKNTCENWRDQASDVLKAACYKLFQLEKSLHQCDEEFGKSMTAEVENMSKRLTEFIEKQDECKH